MFGFSVLFFIFSIFLYFFSFNFAFGAPPHYDNPLGAGGPQNIIDFICLVLNFLAAKIMPPIAVLLILWAGFMYLIAGASVDNIRKAKNILVSTVIGVVVLLTAPALVVFIGGALGGVGNFYYCTANSVTGNLQNALINIINWTAWFFAVISVVMGIYSAFLYLTSKGDPERVKTATRVLFFTVVGIIVAVLAFSIIFIVNKIIS